MPCAAATRAISTASAIVFAPSSTPGRICACRSNMWPLVSLDAEQMGEVDQKSAFAKRKRRGELPNSEPAPLAGSAQESPPTCLPESRFGPHAASGGRRACTELRLESRVLLGPAEVAWGGVLCLAAPTQDASPRCRIGVKHDILWKTRLAETAPTRPSHLQLVWTFVDLDVAPSPAALCHLRRLSSWHPVQ